MASTRLCSSVRSLTAMRHCPSAASGGLLTCLHRVVCLLVLWSSLSHHSPSQRCGAERDLPFSCSTSTSSSFPVPGVASAKHQRKNKSLISFVLPSACERLQQLPSAPLFWPILSICHLKIAPVRPHPLGPQSRLTNFESDQPPSSICSNSGPCPILIGDS
ncbi:hypothetical protein BKA80DRAFT_55101 [Phyllosticta citrichinensis]